MFLAYLLKTIRLTIIVIAILLFTRSFIVEPGKINGRSMENTYYDDQLFFVNKFYLLFSTPKRGQIIQVATPETSKLLIKRIIGLPGEQIKIQKNSVYIINQQGEQRKLNEPYLKKGMITKTVSGDTVTYPVIEENQYFILGDNRRMSEDSRNYGVIDRSRIQGLVME